MKNEGCTNVRQWIGILALVITLLPCAPTTASSSDDATIIVLYDTSKSTTALRGTVTTSGWTISKESTTYGLMRIKPGTSPTTKGSLLTALDLDTSVRAAEEEAEVKLHRQLSGKQSHYVWFDDELSSSDIRGQTAFTLIDVPATPPTAPSTLPRLAMLDGGFESGHEALPSSAIDAQFDVIDNDSDAMDTGNDIDDDGDGVTDGGVGHGLGMAGSALVICPHAELLLCRILDDEGLGTTLTLAAGISWAIQQDADVINISAGMSGTSQVVDALLADAAQEGIVVVAAAGNDSADDLDYPASNVNVLAVAGTDDAGDVDLVSNYETDVFISAPSDSVAGAFPGTTDGYGWWSGTSVASALVAGAAAFVVGENPTSPDVEDELDTHSLSLGTIPTPRVGKVGCGLLGIDGL